MAQWIKVKDGKQGTFLINIDHVMSVQYNDERITIIMSVQYNDEQITIIMRDKLTHTIDKKDGRKVITLIKSWILNQ